MYQPCFLQSKKRYVGYAWSHKDQSEPVFDSKGIETIRRDFCPLASKSLKKCLRVLFDTRDLSEVKKTFLKICTNVNTGNVKLNDFFLSRTYKGLNSYSLASHPMREIVRQLVAFDENSEPTAGDRVAYVIVTGSDKATLSSLVRPVSSFLNTDELYPNNAYYLVKQIVPPLNRFFSLLHVDIAKWYLEVSNYATVWQRRCSVFVQPKNQATITQYFSGPDLSAASLVKELSRNYVLQNNAIMIRKVSFCS